MQEIKQLLAITDKLRKQYPSKNFSLDGKLVGDIGEVLVAEKYGIELYEENAYKYDGKEIEAPHREVQIKASFKYNSYFPYGLDKIPEHFLSVNINNDGTLEELFNGPGKFIYDNYIIARGLKGYKKTEYQLAKNILQKLNKEVPSEQKIKKVS